MATIQLPSQEVLRQLLDYDPETGKLFWKDPGSGHFSSASAHKFWVSRCATKEAFKSPTSDGYLVGRILGVLYKSHRVVWKWVYGSDPEAIDHINGRRSDNRIANLRSVSISENGRNQKRPSRNTSGILGVHFYKARNKWTASIKPGLRTIHLGYFDSAEDAALARKNAERTYGFHENHGRITPV